MTDGSKDVPLKATMEGSGAKDIPLRVSVQGKEFLDVPLKATLSGANEKDIPIKASLQYPRTDYGLYGESVYETAPRETIFYAQGGTPDKSIAATDPYWFIKSGASETGKEGFMEIGFGQNNTHDETDANLTGFVRVQLDSTSGEGEVKVKPSLWFYPTSQPTTPQEGMMYYDSTAQDYYFYDGTSWELVGGGAGGGVTGTGTQYAIPRWATTTSLEDSSLSEDSGGTIIYADVSDTFYIRDAGDSNAVIFDFDAGSRTINFGSFNDKLGKIDIRSAASTVFDIYTYNTGTQNVIDITPSASLAAGSTWRGIDMTLNALDPATGAASTIHGIRVNAANVDSVDADANIYGYVFTPSALESCSGFYAGMIEATQSGEIHRAFYSYMAQTLSTTATYQGLFINWDGTTRDANAPVLEGLRVELPADLSNFGTSFAAYFSADGRYVKICDTYDAILTDGVIKNRADNSGIYTGAGDDLRLYHDGNSKIENSTGGLWLHNTAGYVVVRSSSDAGLVYLDGDDNIQMRDYGDSYAVLFDLDTDARTLTIGTSTDPIDVTINAAWGFTFWQQEDTYSGPVLRQAWDGTYGNYIEISGHAASAEGNRLLVGQNSLFYLTEGDTELLELTEGGVLTIGNADTSLVADQVVGAVQFYGNDASVEGEGVYGKIETKVLVDSVGSTRSGYMEFNLTTTTSQATHLRVGSTVNSTSYQEMRMPVRNTQFLTDSNRSFYITANGFWNGSAYEGNSASYSTWQINMNTSNDKIQFKFSDSGIADDITLVEKAYLESSGDFYVDGGYYSDTTSLDLQGVGVYATLRSSTSYVHLQSAGGQSMYFDCGGDFNFRDQDNADNVIAALDSSTGDLQIDGDLTLNGKILSNDAGGDMWLYPSTANQALTIYTHPSGTQDASGMLITNDSDQSNFGYMDINVNGPTATLAAVGTMGTGGTAITKLNISEAGLATDIGSAISISSGNEVTKIGQDTHTSGQFLKWDGSKCVWDTVSGSPEFYSMTLLSHGGVHVTTTGIAACHLDFNDAANFGLVIPKTGTIDIWVVCATDTNTDSSVTMNTYYNLGTPDYSHGGAWDANNSSSVNFGTSNQYYKRERHSNISVTAGQYLSVRVLNSDSSYDILVAGVYIDYD